MTMPPAAPPYELSKQEDQQSENCVEEEEGYGGYGYRREGFGSVRVMSRVEAEGYYNCHNNDNKNIINCSESWVGIVSSDCDQIAGLEVGSRMGDHLEEGISRSNSVSVSLNEAGGSSSKGTSTQQDKDEGSWLQLGIPSQVQHKELPAPLSSTPLVELDLLSSTPLNSEQQACRPMMIQAQAQAQAHPALEIRGAGRAALMNMSYPAGGPSFGASNLLFQHTPTTGGPAPTHHQDSSSTWAFGPIIPYTMHMGMGLMPPPPPSSSSSSFRTHPHHLASYFPRPFHFPPTFDDAGLGPGPGPSSDIRVVDPPRRPQSGIWFMLQASPTQAKEPFLPQIPKSYLRIKDGRMTVRLLLKYLVNKLRLDSESEIEIRCRGQQLVPFLTLEHVRDNIWSHRDAAMTTTLLSESSTSTSTSDHVMVLLYGRCA